MRKIYLCFAAIGSMAIMGAVAACSSDDSTDTGGTDSGTVDGGGGDAIVKTDSGGGEGGPADSGPCVHCAQLITGAGPLSKACTDSLTLALAAVSCACDHTATGGAGEGNCDVDSGTLAADGGPGACAAFCASPTTTLPDQACAQCGADNCTTEFAACQADTSEAPADAGADADAG